MATNKFYSYYLRGGQIALIEQDINDNNRWKSPASTVIDGLEIEYAYSPRYRINDIEDKTTAITGYDESSGLLKFTGSGLSTDAAITYIVIEGSARWNGLHKINTLNASYWIVDTKYNGIVVTENPTAYTDINALTDEEDELDLPEYLAKALVYYVKAKIAEDQRDIELKEYFMKEFRRMVEKQESSKIWGARLVVPASNAIR